MSLNYRIKNINMFNYMTFMRTRLSNIQFVEPVIIKQILDIRWIMQNSSSNFWYTGKGKNIIMIAYVIPKKRNIFIFVKNNTITRIKEDKYA